MYVIETLLPDGPHWYAGLRVKDTDKGQITAPEWSPYWGDRKEYQTKAEASIVYETIARHMEGAKITEVEYSKKNDARWTNGGRYYIRAKYLTNDMQVGIAGKNGVWTVYNTNKKNIFLSTPNDLPLKFTRSSTVWVELFGKKKNKE